MTLLECEERKDALFEELNSLDKYDSREAEQWALVYAEIRKNLVQMRKIEEEIQDDNMLFSLEESLRKGR